MRDSFLKNLIKLLWGFIMSLFQDQTEQFIKDSKHKVICRYRVIDDENKIAEGEMYFCGHIFSFTSGGAGKGYAPKGNYKAYKLLPETREAFTMFGFGWQVPLEAQFETERWGIAIHPNGKDKRTLGCTAIDFKSLDENVLCYNLFRDWFDKSNILQVEIV